MSQYDLGLIHNRINEFQSKYYQPEELTLYFDLDNTLCLFSPYGDTEGSCRAMYKEGFYRGLPCFEEAPAVLTRLIEMGFRVKILSACIDTPYCVREKLEWVKNHLPFLDRQDVLLLDVGQSKSSVIKCPKKSILIDDYYINLVDMYQAGGIGVKKTFSNKKRTIPQVGSLIEIFGVLQYLNCLN